jgi:hypothetical protein
MLSGRAVVNIQIVPLQLKEGRDQLEIAVHYGIPYPRLHHKQHLVDHLYPPDVGNVGAIPPSRYALAIAAFRLCCRHMCFHRIFLTANFTLCNSHGRVIETRMPFIYSPY